MTGSRPTRVFFFGDDADAAEAAEPPDRNVLGGKGASLAAMSRAGLPVPPGFTISTDACRAFFEGSEQWYQAVARSRPPRDRPWYHVLPHASAHTTYVAERNLEPDDRLEPIEHPLLSHFFDDFRDGRYVATQRVN